MFLQSLESLEANITPQLLNIFENIRLHNYRIMNDYNAKPEVVEADRARFTELQEAQGKIAVAMQRLKDAE